MGTQREVDTDSVHRRIDRWLGLARRQLNMDVAFITELVDGEQAVRYLSSATATCGWRPGTSVPQADGYCTYLVNGTLPAIVHDARHHPLTSTLPATEAADIGAYIGAPITLSNGVVFGALCATSKVADYDLGDAQLSVLTFLAGVLAQELSLLERSLIDRKSRQAVVGDLIARGAFEVVFQPIVEISSGMPRCVEALARFPEFAGGWAEVSAIADEAGLLVDLELALARRAIDTADTTVVSTEGPCRIGINVSSATLMSPELAELVAAPRTVEITLEITEYAMLVDDQELRDRLALLRALGATIAIDDTGSGYAGFNMLVVVNPDVIKVDLALVRHIDDDPVRRAMMRSIVAFGQEIDAFVVAEGIESDEELAAVRATGCDLGQGYLIGRPTRDFARAWRPVDVLDGIRA